MQAHTAKFSVSLRSASFALEGVVLLSLPLLLIGSSRCGTPAWRANTRTSKHQQTPHRPQSRCGVFLM